MVKNPPANAGDVRDVGSTPGWEDPLEEEMAPTPVFLPGEAHGQRGQVGCRARGCKELDTAEGLSTAQNSSSVSHTVLSDS